MIEQRLQCFEPRCVSVGGKALSYREAGDGPALVLLHGIGSSSGSWLFQLEALAPGFRVIAWDAPGYGGSDVFTTLQPQPLDYARALSVLLNALQLRDVVLVAQSLGALMAAAYVRHFSGVAGMLLISPALGYRGAHERIRERLRSLEELGPQGLAEKRAAGMLSPDAAPLALELVQWSYRRIQPEGYRQAAYCLANGNLREDAPYCRGRVLVACGSADTVTPEPGCREIAAAFPNGAYRTLPGLGHASQIEGPAEVNEMISRFAC